MRNLLRPPSFIQPCVRVGISACTVFKDRSLVQLAHSVRKFVDGRNLQECIRDLWLYNL